VRGRGSVSYADALVKPGAWLLLWCAGTSLWLVACPAAAEPAVRVIVAGRARDVAALTEALREPLGRLHVELATDRARRVDPQQIVEPDPQAEPAVARLWFDLSQPDEAVLYVTDPERTHVYVRRVPLPHGLDEVAREQLTYIARACVETLLAGGELGVTREEYARQVRRAPVRAPPAPPPPPPPSRSTLAVGLSGFYEAGAFASGLPVVHGPGLGFSLLRAGSRFRPLLLVTAQQRIPGTFEGSGARATFTTTALRLGVGGDFAVSRAVSFRGSIGGGVDLHHVTPDAGGDALALRPAFWATDPLARFTLGLGLPVWGLRMWLLLGTDLATRDSRYVVLRGAATDPVLSPWRFRPWASLALEWDSE
jgi:hypothetical protein